MSEILIRRANSVDADPVSKLLNQLGYETPIDKLAASLSSEQRNDEIYVYLLNNRIVGVMSLMCFDYFPSLQRICRITAIVVDESARGYGVGTALIRFAKQHALEHCCEILEVTTSLKRDKTHKYYESIGFSKSSYRYFQHL